MQEPTLRCEHLKVKGFLYLKNMDYIKEVEDYVLQKHGKSSLMLFKKIIERDKKEYSKDVIGLFLMDEEFISHKDFNNLFTDLCIKMVWNVEAGHLCINLIDTNYELA